MNNTDCTVDTHIKAVKENFEKFNNLRYALLDYIAKTENLSNFASQVKDIVKYDRAAFMDAQLDKKTISGLKPDAYILVRNRKLIVEYSYHFMRDLIFKKFNEFIEAHIFTKDLLCTIEKIDLLNRQVYIDATVFSAIKKRSFEIKKENILREIAGVLIIVKNPLEDTINSSVFFCLDDLQRASSTQNGHSFVLEVPKKKRNGYALTLCEQAAFEHKTLEMIKKTAIKMYVRNYYSDLSEVDVPEDEYTDFIDDSADRSEPQEVDEDTDTEKLEQFKKLISEAKTEADLSNVALLIKEHTPKIEDRNLLFKLFQEKKMQIGESGTDETKDAS